MYNSPIRNNKLIQEAYQVGDRRELQPTLEQVYVQVTLLPKAHMVVGRLVEKVAMATPH